MSRKVLIVDDIPFVRKTLSQILARAHYQIVGEAANGEEAYEVYCKQRPDIVTMDVVMPIMGGIECTKKILKADKDAKIIIVSAMNQETLIMDAINAGARDYIVKPFKESQILMAFEHILQRSDRQAAV